MDCSGSTEGCGPQREQACVPSLSSAADRLAALRSAVASEPEPLVTLTRLLRLCRDEHPVLWERAADPACRARSASVRAELTGLLPAPGAAQVLHAELRRALSAALQPGDELPPVVVARGLAELIDLHYGNTFAGWFARHGPYQPRVGDPVPLDGVDLRRVTALAPTTPPWRLANRLDETRRVRLAGEWAAQFRVVFDYGLAETLAGLIDADTIVATCHPNSTLDEFDLPRDRRQLAFPVRPADPDRQLHVINELVGSAVAAGASIVVLPELCVTAALAFELQDWVRRPGGPRLLVAGSYHHSTYRRDPPGGDLRADAPDPGGGAAGWGPGRRRNTALAWVRGGDRPIIHDKHSPADRPLGEDITPQGWPELRVHVTNDGWHLVLAICRDLLNPLAVHALTEAGVNLVLAGAMSETVVPFSGPVAHLVGDNQALVVVANNPALWTHPAHPGGYRRPARALVGHPGFGQLTRSVPAADPVPGVVRLHVHSGELGWLPAAAPHAAHAVRALPEGAPGRDIRHRTPDETAAVREVPGWVGRLAERTTSWPAAAGWPATVTLRTGAVLVLLTAGPGDGASVGRIGVGDEPKSRDGVHGARESAAPWVLLTRRAADLTDYPGQLVFPGGAAERGDDGPVATALREAREEIGLDPDSVQIIGVLPSQALTDSGFLVTPVLAWSARLALPGPTNLAEVSETVSLPLHRSATAATCSAVTAEATLLDMAPADVVTDGDGGLGRMTAAVLGLVEQMIVPRCDLDAGPPVAP